MIYYIRCKATGLIKVGHAENPKQRFSNIQCGCPTDLELLAVEHGGREREAELHALLAHCRHRGEWFAPAPELTDHIAKLPRFKRVRRFGGKLGEWLYHNDMRPFQFAKMLGVNKSMVSRLCAGTTQGSAKVAERVAELTNGEVILARCPVRATGESHVAPLTALPAPALQSRFEE